MLEQVSLASQLLMSFKGQTYSSLADPFHLSFDILVSYEESNSFFKRCAIFSAHVNQPYLQNPYLGVQTKVCASYRCRLCIHLNRHIDRQSCTYNYSTYIPYFQMAWTRLGCMLELYLVYILLFYMYYIPRTTDAQRGNSLHCTAKNSLPLPNFQLRPKHILSATLAQFFRYL